jgi:transketolase
MRQVFCQSLVAAAECPELVFLTGDLGFGALEPLRDRLGRRFLNAGVAEQNMVAVAAGLARNGLRPWVYSIAPFVFARPFEQIRNDVCLHGLPVVLVGNGGGYGYGVMGATHHALEDYGVLTCLPTLRAYVPAFDDDLRAQVTLLKDVTHPAYLRLGVAEPPPGVRLPAYAPWRRLLAGRSGVVLVVGPLVGGIWNAVLGLDAAVRPSLWVLTELPPTELPAAFLDDLARSPRLLVVEEHVPQAGAGAMIARALLECGRAPTRFATRAARGYPSGRAGSQTYHRAESGLDAASIVAWLVAEHAAHA